MVVARAMAMVSSTVTSGKAVTRARRGIRAGRRSVRVAGGEEGASMVNPDLGCRAPSTIRARARWRISS